MNKKSAWYNSDILPSEMVKGSMGELWPWGKIENSEQFQILSSFLKNIEFEKIVDVGCGSVDIGRLYPQ
jgi:hypothetical protein